MVVVVDGSPITQHVGPMHRVGSSVQDEVKLLGDGADPLESAPQQNAEVGDHARPGQGGTLKGGIVGAGKNPRLVGNAGRIGTQSDEVAANLKHTLVLPLFLGEDVAENTALLLQEIVASRTEFIKHATRHERGGGDLRIGMFKFLACTGAMILEDTDVFKAPIAFQILDAMGG